MQIFFLVSIAPTLCSISIVSILSLICGWVFSANEPSLILLAEWSKPRTSYRGSVRSCRPVTDWNLNEERKMGLKLAVYINLVRQ